MIGLSQFKELQKANWFKNKYKYQSEFMKESLKCPNCGASPKTPIHKWTKYVICDYCHTTIQLYNDKKEEISKFKEFDSFKFKRFLELKGIKNYDPISGIIVFNQKKVTVDGDGNVSGDIKLKSKIEKWVSDFMEK